MTEQLYEYKKNVFLRCPECFDEDTIKKVLSHKMMENAIIEEYKDNPLVKICVNNTLHKNYNKYGIDDKYGFYHIGKIRYLDGSEECEYKESTKNIISDISFSRTPNTKSSCCFCVYYTNGAYKHTSEVDIDTFLDMCYRVDGNIYFFKKSKYDTSKECLIDILKKLRISFEGFFSKEQKELIKNYISTEYPATYEEYEESIRSGVICKSIESEVRKNTGLTPIKITPCKGESDIYIDDLRKNKPTLYIPLYEEFKGHGVLSKYVHFYLGFEIEAYIGYAISGDDFLYSISHRLNKLIVEYLESRLKRKYPKTKFGLKNLLKKSADQYIIFSKIIIKYNEYIIKENGKEIDKQSRSKRVV